jgi:hypothetical protein
MASRYVNAEGSLFDVPPAAFGRFRVLRQLGAGATGRFFHGEDPDTSEPVIILALGTEFGPDRAHAIAQGLAELVRTTPAHPGIAAPIEAALDEIEPYLVMRFVPGEPLGRALGEWGPAPLEDLLPRVRLLADALDRAGDAGLVHGALQPHDILVSPESTAIVGVGVAPLVRSVGGDVATRRAYTAPEVSAGRAASPAADQFALAAIAYEWLSGRPCPGGRELVLRERAGVNREALVNALATALNPRPEERHPSCRALCDAVASALQAAPAEPAEPVEPTGPELVSVQPAPVPPRRPERWSNGALLGALAVGFLFGFAAGYMAVPRALMQGEPQAMATPLPPAAPASAGQAALPASARRAAPPVPPPAHVAAAARQAPTSVPTAPPAEGRLLVRSTPSGARVEVDGVARGETPLALRGLDLGSRRVVVSSPGYLASDQRVMLSAGRPSRSLEVKLTPRNPARAAATATRDLPAEASAPVGALIVDSRPAGASVSVDGRPSGVTPLTLENVAAGEHTVMISLAGYRSVTTTVRVVSGTRTRTAISLELVQEQE